MSELSYSSREHLIQPPSLAAFRSASVLVAGDLMLDSYWFGESAFSNASGAYTSRVGIARESACPGGAANVAANAAALGVRTTLLGYTGDDLAADILLTLLRDTGVESHVVRVSGYRTVIKLRVLADNQPIMRVDFDDDFSSRDGRRLLIDFDAHVRSVGAVIISDYAKGTLREVERLISLATSAGKPVIVDPKGKEFSRYRGAMVISPNFDEFQAVVGICRDEAEVEVRALKLQNELGLQAVLLTRSEKGLSLYSRGRPSLHLPSQAREVSDVTGAGDTVVAALGASLAAGFTLEDAAILANSAAGLVVGKPGTATVTLPELRGSLLGVHQHLARGMYAERDLIQLVAQSRRQGERIVMTNGCFDLLHPGHIDYLEKARALGDRLIVAVNDDESVRRLKGSQRPLNPLATRMRMLAALSCVDWVVSFSEDTPERLYSRVLPDVLVKGGDYRPEDIAGARQVVAAGGEVRVLDFLQGHSTTGLIERIRESR